MPTKQSDDALTFTQYGERKPQVSSINGGRNRKKKRQAKPQHASEAIVRKTLGVENEFIVGTKIV
jgi:hypothetical protein